MSGKSVPRVCWCVVLSAVAFSLLSPGQVRAEHIASLLDLLSSPDADIKQNAEQELQELCWKAGAPDHGAERKSLCETLATHVVKVKSGRLWILRQLERVGHDESVDALAELLTDPDDSVAQAAQRALANNPSPRASEKLRRQLGKERSATRKIGLANALGYRAADESLAALATLLADPNPRVASAAAAALGRIGSAAANTVLAGADEHSHSAVNAALSLARLKCAESLETSDGRAAAAIYQALSTTSASGVRQAALRGQLVTGGSNEIPLTLEFLASDDRDRLEIATAHVRSLSDPDLRQLASGLKQLPPAAQVALMTSLADRRATGALKEILGATESDNADVRLGALAALGRVGNASVVPLLLDKANRDDTESGVAVKSLTRLFAEGVDDAIFARFQSERDAAKKYRLLQVLVQRRCGLAVPALLQEVAGATSERSRFAARGLGRLAKPDDIPAVIQVMFQTNGRDRDDVKKAVVSICERINVVDQQADPVIAAYRKARGERRYELLTLLGRLGGTTARDEIRKALRSREPQEFAAGLNALSSWPDGTVAEDLLQIAKTTQSDAHRIRAVRSLARVAVLGTQRPESEKFRLLSEAMQLAQRDDERNLILQRASAARTFDSLALAMKHLDDPKFKKNALKTALNLASREEIRSQHPQEVDSYMRRVIAATDDPKLLDRARSYMSDTGR